MDMTSLKIEFARYMFEIGVFKFRPEGFLLKLHEKYPSAPRSPFYINLRAKGHPVKPGPLGLGAKRYLVELFKQELMEQRYDVSAVVGIPEAGMFVADALREAILSHHPQLMLHDTRLLKYEDVKNRRIDRVDPDSQWVRGSRVLLADDVVTQAQTKIEAIKVLRSEGLWVNDLFVVIDRQQRGAITLQDIDVVLHPLYSIYDLLELYLDLGMITQDIYDRSITYLSMDF